ncbi:MAG: prevent-host-death family protein [Omnitrophica WOR_2 bacterium GWF2_43_52]|nr:MAG: prevent-host-death family protein [Omnitrophica WOR_2 bacterium GWA2_44_7]OGX21292.1 MAG: prevent-host-death family protein [Omnitrophica WOR_2 bacterium GWF2_43_52]OGX55968.1 MAG: prevent-host-death family protein [Omnitrophica WOR_2 bacterium RIFOXYC2_FULL_43_9]HAH19598.1 prevent-host-death family protein [Candidatus Omnitrophota bacterium]HBG62767.1 prevent-host-death family protein [Candidatus Omnitrophota bacterium]
MTIHAQILKRNGRKEFAILPYGEFLKVQEILDDYEDLRALRAAKAKGRSDKTVSMEEANKILHLN